MAGRDGVCSKLGWVDLEPGSGEKGVVDQVAVKEVLCEVFHEEELLLATSPRVRWAKY